MDGSNFFEVFARFFLKKVKNRLDWGIHLHLDRASLSKIMLKRPLGTARPHRDSHLLRPPCLSKSDEGQVAEATSPTIRGDTQWFYKVHFPGAEISLSGPNKTERLSIKS